jgi:hypothetical protein
MEVINMLQNAQYDSSQSPLQAGGQTEGQQTKYEIQRLELNAQTVLGLSGEMLTKLVKQVGELALGLVLQHVPISQIGEITDSDAELKMMPIVIPNRSVEGKSMSRKIEFTDDMPVSEEDEMKKSFDILADEESKNMSIYRVNPEIMDRLKFLVKVEPVFMDRATKISKAISLYDRLLQNPLANIENATKDLLLGQLVPGEEYKYLKDAEQPLDKMVKDLSNSGEQEQPAKFNQPVEQPAMPTI